MTAPAALLNSNLDHPRRNPATGLVDEDAAAGSYQDYPDGALDALADRGVELFEDELDEFGDGRSIVSVDVAVTPGRVRDSAPRYLLMTRIRPRADQAPTDNAGWPLAHFLVSGDSFEADTAEQAAAWLVARGLNADYVAERLCQAEADHSRQQRRKAQLEQARTVVVQLVAQQQPAAGDVRELATVLAGPHRRHLQQMLEVLNDQLEQHSELNGEDLAELLRDVCNVR